MPGHIHGSRTRGACAETFSTIYERGRLGSTAELPFGAKLYGRIVGNGNGIFLERFLTALHLLTLSIALGICINLLPAVLFGGWGVGCFHGNNTPKTGV